MCIRDSRNSIQTYVEFDMDAERIGAIGKVFPAIFFLVAALVSLTTMTRMIEEERTQIGTLKALGYSKASIAAKYLLYALSASVAGGILGVLVGSKVLPAVIIAAYSILSVSYTHLDVYKRQGTMSGTGRRRARYADLRSAFTWKRNTSFHISILLAGERQTVFPGEEATDGWCGP